MGSAMQRREGSNLDLVGTGRAINARGDALVSKFQAWAEDEGVFDELFETLRRNLTAKTVVRASKLAGADTAGAYDYETVDDCGSQIRAAQVLAQILRLTPTSGGVVVNNGPTQTVNISASERVAELAAVGVPPELLERACLDLIEASRATSEKGAQVVKEIT